MSRSDAERQKVMNVSPVAGQYDKDIDRESAYEILARRADEAAKAEEAAREKEAAAEEEVKESRRWTLPGFGDEADAPRDRARSGGRTAQPRPRSSGYQRQTVTEVVIKTVARTAASSIGRAIVRGILGSLKKGL
jgi:Bacterial protein of unknown function (DUF853).